MKLKEKRKQILKFGKLETSLSSSEEKTSSSEYEPEDDDSDSEVSVDVELSGKMKVSTPEHNSTNFLSSNKKKSDQTSDSELDSDSVSIIDESSDKIRTKMTKKQNNQDSTTTNSSLDLSINIQAVGPVLKNKKNEVLKTSDVKINGYKKNVCIYCFKQRQKSGNPNKKVHFVKLVDHYESAHPNEDKIKELIKIPKERIIKGVPKSFNQKKREKILEILRNKGNSLNNRQVTDVSEYVVARRPKKNSFNTVANYGQCYKCLKQLSLSSIHKHVHKCTGISFKSRHVIKSSSRATTGDYCMEGSEGAIKIISKMREDEILDEIRYDKAIFYWLNAEASKQETNPHLHNKIRANLRRLGRLKLEMKIMNDKIEDFSDIFNDLDYLNI